MKNKIVVKKNIINLNDFEFNNLSIDNYLESIIRGIFDTNKSIKIIKKEKYCYSIYLEDNYECDLKLDSNIILFDYELKLIYKDKVINYLIDDDGGRLNISMNAYSYKKNNVDYFVTKCSNIYEGIIINRCNKIDIALESNMLNDEVFRNILETINCNDSLEELYNKLNNNFSRVKIVKSRLIDNKTNEIITDKIIVKDNLLEELKVTIDSDNKKYVIEKINGNYVVTYVNSSLEDISKSIFNINNNTKTFKSLEKRKFNK